MLRALSTGTEGPPPASHRDYLARLLRRDVISRQLLIRRAPGDLLVIRSARPARFGPSAAFCHAASAASVSMRPPTLSLGVGIWGRRALRHTAH